MHRIRTASTASTASTATLARAQLAAATAGDRIADRVAGRAQRRLDRLREESESGAQTAEYAMLGGVGAAACGCLVYLLKETDVLENFAREVFKVLTGTVGKWFS